MANPEKEKNSETIGEKPKMEIRTMRKDLARLRLLESEQEREKIVELQKQKRTGKKDLEDLERIEEFQEQKQEKQEKRMRRIRLFRGKKKEKPIPAKTETETPEIILEKPPLPPESLISASPLPEFAKPSAPPALPDSAGASRGRPALPDLPKLPVISASPLPETEKPQPSPPPPPPELAPALEKDLKNQRNNLLKQRQDIIKAMSLTVSEEKRIEQKVRLIEEEEAKPDLEDRQSIEKTRRYLEKQRNTIEERRWRQEKQSQEIEQKIKKIDSDLAKIGKPAPTFSAQSPAQASKISAPTPAQAPAQAPAPMPQKPEIPVESEPLAASLFKPEQKPPELPVQKKPLGPKLTPEQRLAQAKQRLASFKEQIEQTEPEQIEKELETKEIDKFRERLKQSAALKKGVVEKAPDAKKMFEGGVEIYRDMPAKQPKSQKLLTRIAFILAILLGIGVLAGLVYWLFTYWFSSKQQADFEITEPSIIVDITDEQDEQEITAPEPIIPVENRITLEISEDSELSAILIESLNKDLGQSQFAILNIKLKKNFLNLKEFLRILEIQMPLEISQRLEPEFTLFMYSITESQTQTLGPNRLGFVAKIKQQEQIDELMRNWEQSMENDTETFFTGLGKTRPAAAKTFSQANYKNSVFRYISFSQKDFGICWAVIDNYFIFTSSGEAMIKTIDLVKNLPLAKSSEISKTDEAQTAWQLFQILNSAIEDHDFEKMNAVVYEQYSPDEYLALGFSENDLWQIIEGFWNINQMANESEFNNFFSNKQEDSKQMVLSSEGKEAEPQNYSKSYIYFIKNSQGKLFLLNFKTQTWHYSSYEEAMAAMADKDGDGLTDQRETCKYEPDCVKTNPNLKDTDGDGWWDSTETEAKTDPNNQNSRPYSY